MVPFAYETPVSPTKRASCDRCDNLYSGDPIVKTTTDVNGRFTLTGIPAGADIPLVIRRQGKTLARLVVDVPHVGKRFCPRREAGVIQPPFILRQLELPGVRAHRHVDTAALAHGHVLGGILQTRLPRSTAHQARRLILPGPDHLR